ncbi:hypothetical protein NECAME_09755, partial [Necator americanus]
LCQQIHDTVLSTRDRLAQELEKSQEEAERICKEQIKEIAAVMGPIRLCLMSAQILCSSASAIDVLQLSSELNKRVQSILSRAIKKLPTIRSIDPVESRTEIARALEPFLGLSAAWCPIAVTREGSQEGSGSMKSFKTRSGSHSMPTMLTKFQTMIDLSGAFGSIFARVEEPLKDLSIDLGQLGERVQEAQRDLTMRRCLIRANSINSMIKDCAGVETRLGLHSAVLNDLQPELQQMWQEQLDRVEQCLSMRETARHVLTAAKQLVPYAACIENMSALIDPKRCHPPDPAPMESICMQITGIEPNSESRILAIEKEEQNRRAVQEAKKREELAERGTPVKGLKHAKANRKDTTRSSSVREETASDLEMESAVWRENFELTSEERLEKADLAIQEEERCSSSLSLTAQICNHSPSLPPLEQLLGRIPLANRVVADIGKFFQILVSFCEKDVEDRF